MRAWVANSLLAASAVAVVLLVAEVGCRLAGYSGLEKYRPDGELGWVLARAQRTVTKVNHLPVRISDEGFRDEPLERPKPLGTVRVFSVGNSATFGWGVREEDVYSHVLERILGDEARAAGVPTRYEIVNAGVNAYNLRQVFGVMRRIVERYEPDGFIVAYTFNDAWNKVGELGPKDMRRVLLGVRVKNVLRRFALYNWLVEMRARRLYDRLRAWAAGPAVAVYGASDSVDARDLEAYRATLDSIVGLARRARVSLAFVVLAANGQTRPRPHQVAMLEAAARARLPALDLVSALGGMRVDSLYLPSDDVHLSPPGHRWVAERLDTQLCAAAAAAGAEQPAGIYRDGCGARRGRR